MTVGPPPESSATEQPASAPFSSSPAELLQQFDESQRLAGIGSWSWDLRTGVVAWSKETYRVLRVPLHMTPSFELVISRAIDEEHAQQFMDHVNAALRGEVDYDFEIAARVGPDEDEVVVHTRGVVERDAAGQPVRMTGTVQDVTAMRRAENALRDSEAQFRTLADASPMGVFRTDSAGTPTYANARLLDWFGCDYAAFCRGEWMARVHADDLDRLHQEIARTVGRPLAFDAEYRVIVDDQVRWLRVRTQPLLDITGASSGHVGSVVDTSPERYAEAERARLHAQLEQARRLESLGLLAGGVAHDFNNLLVGILANASHAREDVAPGSPTREMLDDIVRSAQRAGDLTRQLLAYAGRSRADRKPVALATLVEEVPSLLGARIPATVRMEIDVRESPIVDGDETQLRQVVLNLVTNAVDAMSDDHGAVTITVSRERVTDADLATCLLGSERTAGRYAVITVRDTGCGMSRDIQERMFDPFFSTKRGGRGLGLAATLGIIQAHGGAVSVASREGDGTTVRLLLPIIQSMITPTQVPAVTLPSYTGSGTVLLVDDDDGARAAARRILARAGFRVEEATNGQEALDRFAALATPPCLLLLDLTMPVMGGAECLTRLRAGGTDTPVLIVSGYDPDDVASMLVERGDAQLLRKPYTASELLEAVRAVLG